jgi:alpha-glucosidase (family GH31 glycosyl hydrolase)
MPIIQFSIPPWRFDEECVRICTHYYRLHAELAPRTYHLVEQRQPIVRPLWWIAPTDETALTCDDEYLVGDDLLVAPVIHEHHRARDIYLPIGTWRSYWNHDEVYPSGWLRDYPAPLDLLPLFERLE